MSNDAIVSDRLAELVACLSGSPDSVARIALDLTDENLNEDPLAAVASAIVAIRHDRVPALASSAV